MKDPDAERILTNMTRAVLGLDEFIIKRASTAGWCHLWRKGDRFPLAGGPIGFIRKHFERLTA